MNLSSLHGNELKDNGENSSRKKKRSVVFIWVVRAVFILLVVSAVVAAKTNRFSLGRVCTLGTETNFIVCPLGYLETALASRSLLPKLLPGVGLAILLIILFGRAFCAWICPGALLTTLRNKIAAPFSKFRKHKPAANNNTASSKAGALPANHAITQKGMTKNGRLTSLVVLAGALVSAYAFGFPVFCLICPVGLFFGTVFATLRLFHNAPAGLELLIFPALLVAEFFLFKSWCSKFCPLGALYSLIGSLNPSLKLRADKKKCLLEKGVNCKACETACPEGINIGKVNPSMFGPGNCNKCLDCIEKCPLKAVKLKVI